MQTQTLHPESEDSDGLFKVFIDKEEN